ncbi:MAG: TraR/DksA C4-type zinc finger protein, partial [Acidothermaceae bacterium]
EVRSAPAKKSTEPAPPAKKATAKKVQAQPKRAPAKAASTAQQQGETVAEQASARKPPARAADAAHIETVHIETAQRETSLVDAAPAEEPAPARTTVVRPAPPAPRVAAPAPVVEDDPWTEAELAAIRAELEGEVDRLRGEIEIAETDLADRLRDGGDGAGDDQADAGTKTFEREHEMSLANNARDLLVQTEHALDRIAAGTYGRCENCGNPIGKLRLQANPRATLCVSCKQREERR